MNRRAMTKPRLLAAILLVLASCSPQGDPEPQIQGVDLAGAQIGAGKKSVAFALTFRASDRTLTEPEVLKAMEQVQRSCAALYGAVLR